jgi:hypothetical protein
MGLILDCALVFRFGVREPGHSHTQVPKSQLTIHNRIIAFARDIVIKCKMKPVQKNVFEFQGSEQIYFPGLDTDTDS